MDYLENKILLITGSTGIAEATIKLALQKKAKVFFASFEAESCKQLKEEIIKLKLGDAAYCVGDLTKPNIAKEIVNGCISKYGKIDGLFNVAGTSGRKYGDGPLTECLDNGWTKTIQANLDTQFRMCKEVTSVMMKAKRRENGQRGTILNMTSILGIDPEPKNFSAIAYATSKGAIITMTKTMAAYYAKHGIRVNAIAPGLVDTKMSYRANTDTEILSFIKEKQPLKGDILEPNEIAEVALFLLSNQSRAITGQTLIVDAGWSIS